VGLSRGVRTACPPPPTTWLLCSDSARTNAQVARSKAQQRTQCVRVPTLSLTACVVWIQDSKLVKSKSSSRCGVIREICIPCVITSTFHNACRPTSYFSQSFIHLRLRRVLFVSRGARLCLRTAVISGHIVRPPDGIWVWSYRGIILTGENRRTLRKKPVPVPLCPPQIPHGLIRTRTRASAVQCPYKLVSWLSHCLVSYFTYYVIFHIALYLTSHRSQHTSRCLVLLTARRPAQAPRTAVDSKIAPECPIQTSVQQACTKSVQTDPTCCNSKSCYALHWLSSAHASQTLPVSSSPHGERLSLRSKQNRGQNCRYIHIWIVTFRQDKGT
jgi:hypothetical protein